MTSERAKAWPRASRRVAPIGLARLPPAIGPRSPKPTSIKEKWGHFASPRSFDRTRGIFYDVSSAPQRRELRRRTPPHTAHHMARESSLLECCTALVSRGNRSVCTGLSRAAFYLVISRGILSLELCAISSWPVAGNLSQWRTE